MLSEKFPMPEILRNYDADAPGRKYSHLKIDLDREETLQILNSAKIVTKGDRRYAGATIEYKGKTLKLVSTDLCDGLNGSIQWESLGRPVSNEDYMKDVLFGARLYEDFFMIINAISDH